MATRKTRVRAHRRRGTRGVRAHVRMNAAGTRVAPPPKKAVDFFLKNAGYSYPSGASKKEQRVARIEHAKKLARAEQYASWNGWRVEWEEERYPDLSWLQPGEDPDDHETLSAVLRDSNGDVLGGLGNIDFLRKDSQAEKRRYRRLVEAELAYEAMP